MFKYKRYKKKYKIVKTSKDHSTFRMMKLERNQEYL